MPPNVSVKTYDPLCGAKTGCAGVAVAAEAAPAPTSAVPLRTMHPMTVHRGPRSGLRRPWALDARLRGGRTRTASLHLQSKRSFMLQHLMVHHDALDASRAVIHRGHGLRPGARESGAFAWAACRRRCTGHAGEPRRGPTWCSAVALRPWSATG